MDKNLAKLNGLNDFQYTDYVERCRHGFTALGRVIKSHYNSFSVGEFNHMIRQSDVNSFLSDEYNISPILLTLLQSKNVKLTEEWDIDYLINNTDFNTADSYKQMDVMTVFLNRAASNFHILNEDRLFKILKKSDLEFVDDDGWNILAYLMRFGGEMHFEISDDLYRYVIGGSSVSVALEALSYANDEHNRGEFLMSKIEQINLNADLDGVKNVKQKINRKL